MQPHVHAWSELEEDNPIPLLFRKRVFGEKMLFAKVLLKKGCHVTPHRHPSEQMSMTVSGHLRWTLGEPGQEVETRPGSLLHIPSNVLHSVVALEDTEVIDVLSPPGAMGVDSQGR